VGVSVGVHHELDAALDALLVALANPVEDCMDHSIDAFLPDCNYGFNYLLLCDRVVRIDPRLRCSEDSLIALLYYDGVHDLLDEAHMGVYLGPFDNSLVSDLSEGLLIHLLLLGGDALPLGLLLLANSGLVLRDLLAAALTAPARALARAEVVLPLVAFLARDNDGGHASRSDNADAATLLLGLAAHSLHNLDAVVANAVPGVSELPESDLTSVTWLLGCLILLLMLIFSSTLLLESLLVTALLYSVLK